MELINLLTGQPAAVALAILAVYWLNRNTLEFAREKREMLEIIRAERKEWNDKQTADRREIIDLYREGNNAEQKMAERVQALESRVDRELHALRNAIAPIGTNVSAILIKLGETPRGAQTGD